MVAPTTGELKLIIDEMAVQLDTVDELRVHKYPVYSVQELPAGAGGPGGRAGGLRGPREVHLRGQRLLGEDADEQRDSRGDTGRRVREERAQAPLQLRWRQPLGCSFWVRSLAT